MNKLFLWYSLKTFDIKAFIVIVPKVPKVPKVPRNIYIHDERKSSLAILVRVYIYPIFVLVLGTFGTVSHEALAHKGLLGTKHGTMRYKKCGRVPCKC